MTTVEGGFEGAPPGSVSIEGRYFSQEKDQRRSRSDKGKSVSEARTSTLVEQEWESFARRKRGIGPSEENLSLRGGASGQGAGGREGGPWLRPISDEKSYSIGPEGTAKITKLGDEGRGKG